MARFVSLYARHRLVVPPLNKVIEFTDHVYETDDPAEVELLRQASELAEIFPEPPANPARQAAPEPQVGEATDSSSSEVR